MNDTIEAVLARHAGRRVLIDTNLLLLLIVGSCDRGMIGRYGRTSGFSADDHDLLLMLLAQVRGLVVTPHVLTEVSNFLGHLAEPARSELFATTIRTLVTGAEERTFASADLVTEPIFPRVGLTDVAVARVSEDVLVLTDDLKLCNHLYASGADFINYWHLKSGAW